MVEGSLWRPRFIHASNEDFTQIVSLKPTGELMIFLLSALACVQTLCAQESVKANVLTLELSNKDLYKLNRRSEKKGDGRYVLGKAKWKTDAWQPVRLRLRGDHPYHRRYPWKSYRIRWPRDHWREMEGCAHLMPSALDFVLPKHPFFPFHLSNQVNELLGLPTLVSDHVELVENGQNRGTREVFEQYSALTLARNGLPLGAVFKEESNDHMYHLFSKGDLKQMEKVWANVIGERDELNLLKGYYQAAHSSDLSEVSKFVDLENLMAWNIHWQLMGSNHQGGNNVRLYFHPGLNRFQQFPWDLTSMDANLSYVDLPLNFVPYSHRVLHRAMADHRWRHERNRRLHKVINDPKTYERLEREVIAISGALAHRKTYIDYLKDPKNLRGFDAASASERAIQWWEKRARYLKSCFQAKVFHGQSSGSYLLNLKSTMGQQLVGFAHPAVGSSKPTQKLHWGDKVYVADLLGDRGDGFDHYRFRERLMLFPEAKEIKPHFGVIALNYSKQWGLDESVFRLSLSPHNPSGVRWLLKNAHTGKEQWSVEGSIETERGGEIVVGPLEWGEPESEHRVWKGKVKVDQNIVIGSHGRLDVEPGTHITLSKGVGVFVYGQVKLRGTEASPIVVEGVSEGAYTTFALNGAEVMGGSVEHVVLSGGEGGAFRGCDYEGSFSIYHCGEFTMKAVTVRETLGEDGLNIKCGRVKLEQCRFVANNDGLDLDDSTAEISTTAFTDNRNDGLDLGHTEATFVDVHCLGNQDKGLSVGGESFVKGVGVVLKNNKIGLAVKDASKVTINKGAVQDNELGIVCFNKAARYREFQPWLELKEIGFRGNRVDAFRSSSGRIRLENTILRPPDESRLSFDVWDLFQ